MPSNKKFKKNLQSSTDVNGLSAQTIQKDPFTDLEKKLYDSLNAAELKKSMDRWLRSNEGRNATILRDLSILKGINEEYLSSFLILGYTMEGERVIMQSYSSPKDKDAMMEFLKVVFIQNHHFNSDD